MDEGRGQYRKFDAACHASERWVLLVVFVMQAAGLMLGRSVCCFL